MLRTERSLLDIPAALLKSTTPRNRMALCVDYQHGRYGHPARSSRRPLSSVLRRARERLHSRSKMDKCLHISLVDFPRIAQSHRAAGGTILCVLLRMDGPANIGMPNPERSRYPARAPSFEAV